MKKSASILLALAILSSCADNRSEILKVYNWSCYIDENLIGEFEDWYAGQTGEKVKVIYQTFDVNETMLSKIELGHEDYDLVCPSDYIIEKMLRNDLLLPICREFGDTPDYIGGVSPFIRKYFENIDNGRDANDYSVAYMWGTNGLLYNPKYVPDERVRDWSVLQDPSYSGQILMKDAFRDVYTSILVSLRHDEIASGAKTVDEVSREISDESLRIFGDFMYSFRDGIAGWEADFGKEQMVKERAVLSFNWSGDAQWAIEEAAKSGVELRYEVPASGSTIWFDGWVIPKYAKNVKAASYFINFMCMPSNAVRNMNVIGYVSAIAGDEVLEAQCDSSLYAPTDASYFFGPGAESVCVSRVMYPSPDVILGCGMLHDSGDDTAKLLSLWSSIKGESATDWTVIIIVITLLAVTSAVIVSRSAKRHRRRHSRRRR